MLTSLFPEGSTRKIVATNTASQLLGKAVSATAVFLVSLIIAQQYGAAVYGDFVKITTYVGFFFLLADFGLNAIWLRQAADTKQPRVIGWGVLVGLRLVAGGALIFLALALLSFIPRGISQGYTDLVRLGIILLSPAIIFQALITSTNAVFQKQLRYDLATVALAGGSLSALLIVGLALVSPRPPGAIWGALAILCGSVVNAGLGLLLARRFEENRAPLFRFRSLLSLFVPAIPLGLTLLFNLVYVHADSVILTLTRASSEVGIYGLAYKVFEVPLVIPTFFMNAVYPLLLRQTNISRIMKSSLVFLVLSSLFAVVVLWVGAPLLSLIRPEFTASVVPLRVLSLGMPFFFISALVMWALIAAQRQWLLAIIYGLAMLINVLFNAWLIPLYGYIAAAWVTVFSEAVVLLLSGSVLWWWLRFKLGRISKPTNTTNLQV